MTRQGLGFQALDGNISGFDINLPSQTFRLQRTEQYQPLSSLSSTTTGTVGGIVVGAGSNSNLYAAFRDRAFDAPPPKPNPGGGNNGGGSSGGEGGNEGNTPGGGTRGSSPIATVDRQRNQATCATVPTLAAIPTDETRAAKAPSAGCQPLGDDATILKILQEPTSQNPSEGLSQTLAQHHQTAQQQQASLVFNQAPPEAFAPQLRR